MLLLRSQVRSLVSSRFELLQLSLIGYHLAAEVQVFIVSDLVIRVKADSKTALAWQPLLLLIIILIIILVIIFIILAFNLRCLMALLSVGISLAIEDRSVRLNVPLRNTTTLGARYSANNSSSVATASCHVEVLKL